MFSAFCVLFFLFGCVCGFVFLWVLVDFCVRLFLVFFCFVLGVSVVVRIVGSVCWGVRRFFFIVVG